MPQPDETRAEALKRLSARAKALETRTAPAPVHDHGARAAGYGYRLMGVLIGGLFVGMGFGTLADALLSTAPWGMIVGVLTGFAVSIWMAVRSAQRMSAEAAKVAGPAKDLPFDDEED
jgi:ATP synthase protein I